MALPHDLTGRRYGRLEAIRRLPNVGRRTVWEFRCDCGSVVARKLEPVSAGFTRSCGCYQLEKRAEVSAKAVTNSRLYGVWGSMKARCHNPHVRAYPRYGGRGIVVCEEWRNSFATFLADMGDPGERMTLERIDNDGPYSPENCRWATYKEQAANTRRSIHVQTADGREMSLGELAKERGVNYGTLVSRMRRWGLPATLAAEIPLRDRREHHDHPRPHRRRTSAE